ncbi:MAG TPA: serine/threonine-protein kinase [Gemmatimonadales bacterium]|nr:serine/threonine-protein kinase [Gemmatimonadales bacterium]
MSELRPRLATALAGRYRIERELGRGGMAIVYLAHDLRHERVVALKVLRPELGAALGPERFLREIKVAAGLTHPHIVPLFDSGDADGLLFYVMPYVSGESLRQRLMRQTRLPVGAALEIAREAADALAYAHRENIVHRDIKPENILFESGHAVVSDFGVARAISAADTRVTVAGIVVGTPDYMSPEQAAGDSELDGRSDIFSLGCVLFEMLVGRPPRAIITPRGGTRASITGPHSGASIPPAVERLIGRALADRREDRFPDAETFAAALRDVARRHESRRPWLAWGSLAAAAAAAGVLVWRLLAGATGGAEANDILVSATNSPIALAELRRGKSLFWSFDFDGAAAAYRRAIAADSDAILAYHRLSVVETWRWDYPAALRVVERGLARSAALTPKWRELLTAQRYYIERQADSAIVAFQQLVADYPSLPDAWYGLAESVFHFAGFSDNAPQDADPALRHLLGADSTFAPVWEHRVDLALYAGDIAGARRAFLHMHPNDRDRPGQEAAISLATGDPAERTRTFAALRDAERTDISLVAYLFAHDNRDLGLVDSVGALLMSAERTHDDRVRGAQYRFVALAGAGRWADALAAWRDGVGSPPQSSPAFDRWIVHAYLAGWPAGSLAEGMLARASETPASLSTAMPTDDQQEAFRALVHHALLAGDSAVVRRLQKKIAERADSTDPSDPQPQSLGAALAARLALLARDTAHAIAQLELSVARPAQPFMMFYPQLSMAPERMLLAELYGARGDTAVARRWLDSFSNAWSFGDAVYAPRVACVRRFLAARGPGPGPGPRVRGPSLTPIGRSLCP